MLLLASWSTAIAEVFSGTCGANGDNLTWTLDTETGALVISGEGAMANYEWETSPWDSYYGNIASVEITDGVTTIGSYAFRDCYGLTSLTIPNSVTEIGYRAFWNCFCLMDLTISNSVTTIGEGAFWNCFSLMSLTIPNSVTTIGNGAFGDCSGLTSLTIPNSVTEIGIQAFSGCSGLTNISVVADNPYYDSRNDCNAIIETASNTLVAGCKNTVIPNSVTEIGDWAFSGCSGLTSFTIPNSVTTIGNYAFAYCSGLTSLTIPNSVTTIGEEAFSGCSGLTSLTIPNSVTTIVEGAFRCCYGLTSISVAADNPYYDSRNDCNAIIETASNTLVAGCKNTVIPNSVTEIGDWAFSDCSGLTSLTIPNSVTTIGNEAFRFCSGLTSLTIPNSVTKIDSYAFLGCSGLTSLSMLSATPPRTGMNVFYNCNTLTTIYVPVGAAANYDVAPWNSYNIVELEEEKVKEYRIKDIATGLYMNASNYDNHPTGPLGGVNFVDKAESNDQIFIFEADGANYKLKTKSGKYIFCQPWNVDALEQGSALTFVDNGDGTYYIMNGSKYFKVEYVSGIPVVTIDGKQTYQAQVSGYYPYCDASDGAAAKFELEEVEPEAPPVTDPEPQPIEGKYYILKSRIDGEHVAYEKNDGTIGLQAGWEKPSPLQMTDLSFVWKANVVGTDSVRLQNMASQKYLDATYTLYQAYTTTTEEGTIFQLTAADGGYYNLGDRKDLGFPYMHADASRSYVVRWEDASSLANQWQFVDIEDSLVTPLLAQQNLNIALKQAMNQLNAKLYQPIVSDFSNHGLLKSATQLYTNKQETKEGHISNLLDGDGNTYFHSTWSSVNTDSAFHFIQADLGQRVDSITVKYVRRNHSYNDSPSIVRVFATNNPAGEWEEIALLHCYNLQSYFGINFSGGTLNFNLGSKYQHVRFVVEGTYQGSHSNNNLFFSWSEFGIWDNNGEEFLPEDKRAEIDSIMAIAKQELKDLAATQGTIDLLVDWAAYVDKYVFLTDGEDYTNTKEQTTEMVTYTRDFNNTQWQAWYVPFDIEYDAISEDFTAAALNAVHQYDDDEDGVFERWTVEILKLKSGDVMQANLPYMIRAKETGEHKFVVEDATLYPAVENTLDCSSIRVHYTFKGNYSLMDGKILRDNGWYAVGGGSLVTPTVGSNLKAYRWLLMPEARSGYGTFYAPKRIDLVIGDDEGEATAIEEVTLENSAETTGNVYDLNGRLIHKNSLKSLPKGVYIVNGKKAVK